MKHAYVVTERIDGVHNLPNIRDHDASVYLKTQGDAISFGGYEPDPIFTDVRKKYYDRIHCLIYKMLMSQFLFW